jgi:hypothetical protein
MTCYRARPLAISVVRLFALALVVLLATSGGAGRVAAQEGAPIDERLGAVDAYLDPNAAAESRVGWERITFDWSLLQPGPTTGLVNAGLEEEWFTNARSDGRQVVGMLVNTPAWATEGRPGIGVPVGLYRPPGDPGNVWASFVREVVSTYSRRGVNHWIIWDNSNIPSGVYGHGWEGSLEDYYQLVKVAYLVAKEANPEAKIHLAGYSQTYDALWLGRLMEVIDADESAPGNDYYFDVVTLHLYYQTDGVFAGAQTAFYVTQEQYGIFKDVWIVESSAYPPDIALAEYPEVTPEQHASFVIQAFALGLASGVQRVGVARFVDVQSADGEVVPGLLGPAGGPRPAYDAFRVVAERFAGAEAASRTQLELAEYVRVRHSDRVTHVAWARTAQPALLSIPARSDTATLIDQGGNERTLSPEDGRYTVRLEGANCNGPSGTCPIGGPVMVLVETGLDPFAESGPSAPVQAGPAPTLSPDQVTATPVPSPTPVPTIAPTPTPAEAAAPAEAGPTEGAAEVPTQETTQFPPPTAVGTPTPTSIPSPPTGAAAIAPFVLVGLGALLIGGSVGFWLRDRWSKGDGESA